MASYSMKDLSNQVSGLFRSNHSNNTEYAHVNSYDDEENGNAAANGKATTHPTRFLNSRFSLRLVWAVTGLLFLANLYFLYNQKGSILPGTTPTSPTDVTPISTIPDIETPSVEPPSHETAPSDTVNWSDYAYVQYVTNHNYLCNSLMIFEALYTKGSKADRIMMYPGEWDLGADSAEAKLLRKARDDYKVGLVPIHVQHFAGETTWGDSFTKLLAFNQTQYKRVLSLDSDANVLQPMDELFLLPSTPVAMPRAYWLDEFYLSSQLLLVEPSEFEFKRILDAFNSRSVNDFDMEIVNNLYGRDCIILPHRKYDLLTGEFRRKDHKAYLGSEEEVWNGTKVLEEAKFLHFSDWPWPKPWLDGQESVRQQVQPECVEVGIHDKADCSDREHWNWFYSDFKQRRKDICGIEYRNQKREEDAIFARQGPELPSQFEPVF